MKEKFLPYILPLGAFLIACALISCKHTEPPKGEWKVAHIHKYDPNLGYVGIPNASDEDSLKVDGVWVYKTTIRLDENGYREVPGRPKNLTDRCVLLLGDSNPFGIGVETKETVAALLQAKLKNTRVFNMAYSGYGPHQNLRQLEMEQDKALLKGCRQVRAVLFIFEEHIIRVAGRITWALSAPHYKLQQGIPVYLGPFWSERVHNWGIKAEKYPLLQRLMSLLVGYNRPITAKDRELFRAILNRIGYLLRERYQASYQVIFLGRGTKPNAMIQSLESREGPTSYLEEIAHGDNLLERYYLHDATHMNRDGHALIANYLLQTRLKDWTH